MIIVSSSVKKIVMFSLPLYDHSKAGSNEFSANS